MILPMRNQKLRRVQSELNIRPMYTTPHHQNRSRKGYHGVPKILLMEITQAIRKIDISLLQFNEQIRVVNLPVNMNKMYFFLIL